MKTEAADRFQRAMCVANAEMVLGMVGTSAESGLDNRADYQSASGKASDVIQRHIQDQEEEIAKAARRVAESRVDYEAARDRRKRALDNIQKLVDILRSMNPEI